MNTPRVSTTRRLGTSIFGVVAEAVRKELEPQGFHVHVNTNNGRITVTEFVAPGEGLSWDFGMTGGPRASG